MATLGKFVTAALGQVTAAVLCDHGANLDSVFLEFDRIRDLVLNHNVCRHFHYSLSRWHALLA
jgi:hypothetical protein